MSTSLMTIGLMLKAYDQMSSVVSSAASKSIASLSQVQKKINSLSESAERFGRSALASGAIAGGLAVKPLKAFADLEEATTDLKVALMNNLGEVPPQFEAISKQAIDLGNLLPGTTSDFINAARALKEQGVGMDTLDIRLEDVDGLFRGDWYPNKGDILNFRFGYEGHPLKAVEGFEIDDVEGDGPPDVVTIRALSSGVQNSRKTKQARAYENTTLAAIASRIARRLKLQLTGKIEPIQITRITQIHESDLTFLRRISAEYGYAFSVKGTKMVFFKKGGLRKADPILTIDRKNFTRYRFSDKIMGIAKSAQVSYYDSKTGRLKKHRVQDTNRATSQYEIKKNIRAESDAQAKVKAQAALDNNNDNATRFEGTIMGDPRLVAGINFTLTGMGKLNGIYHVTRSRHDQDRDGGYRTEFEAKRVPPKKEKTNG